MKLKEDYCKKWVHSGERWDFGGHQCSRKAVKDGYCTIHHPDYIAEKRKKEEEKYRKKWHNENIRKRINDYTTAARLMKEHGFAEAETVCLENAENLRRELL